MKKLLSLIDIKFWKFILVGLLNTAADAGISFALINLTTLNMWWCTAIPCAIASVLSYFLNKHFTFKNTEKGWKPVFRFVVNIGACYLLAYGIAIPAMEWALGGLGMSSQLQGNLTMLAGSCLFVALNYFGQRFFAFRNK